MMSSALSVPAVFGKIRAFDDKIETPSDSGSPSSFQTLESTCLSNIPRCITENGPYERNPFVRLGRISLISSLSSPTVMARNWCDIDDDEDDDNFSIASPCSASASPCSDSLCSQKSSCCGMPSVGSLKHGTCCTPCVFMFKEGGCKLGADCTFCHLCDKEAFLARKRERMMRGKELQKASGNKMGKKMEKATKIVSLASLL